MRSKKYMARRRFGFRKARRTGSFGRKMRRYAKTGVKPETLLLTSAAYGAAREYISTALTPLTSKIPLGNYADEAVLGIGGFLLAKKGRGLIKQLGTSMMVIEAARIGSGVIGSTMSGSSTTSGSDWK